MIHITKERKEDYSEIDKVIQASFSGLPYSDGLETDLISRIRNSDDYISDLALVAKDEDKFVGYTILSPITIKSEETAAISKGLVLPIIGVIPEYQNKTIGSKLIEKAHDYANALGYKFIVLIGQPEFFQKFDYTSCAEHGIDFHFQVPDSFGLIKELKNGCLEDISGTVHYPELFY